MEKESPRVEFRLFSLGNADAQGMLTPEGTMIFEYLGFPRDLGDCTCIPQGPVSYWCATNITIFDAQWYKPTKEIKRVDVPQILTGSPKVKDHICHRLRPDPNSYPLSALYVDIWPI